MVFSIGIEPTAYRLGGDRSILLSYENKKKKFYPIFNSKAIKIKLTAV